MKRIYLSQVVSQENWGPVWKELKGIGSRLGPRTARALSTLTQCLV